jgi:dihydroneopterin aldolase
VSAWAQGGPPLTIELRGLAFEARHGVLADEREQGQRFSLDLRLVPLGAAACETDRLADAVDYGEVATVAVELATRRAYDLLERVAAVVGDGLLTRFPLERVSVTVHKPQAPLSVPFSDVAVTVTRVRAVD